MYVRAALLSLTLLAPAPAPIAEAEADFEQARAELALAIDAANNNPDAGLERLALALDDLANYREQLIDDPQALEQRTMATLALARGYASAGDEALALELMDRALREAGSFELPIERFGPRTRQLHEQSRAGLDAAGFASVAVDCQVECRLYIDEHEVSNPSPPLWLGARRVLVRAVDAELDSCSSTLVLALPDQAVSLVYPEPTQSESSPTFEPTQPSRRDPGPVPLLVTGGTTLALGVALTAFGGSWWARGQQRDDDPNFSRVNIVDHRPAGKVMVGVGIASFAIGVTLLTLEAVRARKREPRHQVGVDLGARHFGLSVSGRF